MTTPTTKRPPRKAPVPPKPVEPQWPAVGADTATLRAMPNVVYLFTERVPSAHYSPVITYEMDAAIREDGATARALPGEHRLMVDEWLEGAHSRVHGPLNDWLAAFAAPPLETIPTDAAGEAAGSDPASPAEQPEPDEAA